MGGKLDVSRREFLKRDVAVWEGAQRDVNGRKFVTLGWTPLALDATVQADVRH